jgi:phage tail-like protein
MALQSSTIFQWRIYQFIPPVVPIDPPGKSPGIGDPEYQYNQLDTIVETFLGYRPTADDLSDFPFEIYRFIIRSIRDRDQKNGTKLLERFLKGPQEVWANLFRTGTTLKTIFDPEEIDPDYLDSLNRLVGFGGDLSYIITALTDEEKRRIAAGAIEFWRQRWLDSGIVAAVRLVTGNRIKVRDYFDLRFIIGETAIEEDLKNTDPNMLSVKTRNLFREATDGRTRHGGDPYTFRSASVTPLNDDINGFIVIFDDTGAPSNNGFYRITAVNPGANTWTVSSVFPIFAIDLSWFVAFSYDEFITEIRVVDEKTGQGEVNRDLLEDLLELQRPNSERFNVVYVDFLDLFNVDNDLGMWESAGYGNYIATVDNNVLSLTGNASGETGLKTNRSVTDNWENYQWKIKAALKANGSIWFGFYNDDMRLEIGYAGFGTGYVRLWQDIASVWTPVTAQVTFPSLNLDTFWTYTIEAFNLPGGTQVNVKVQIDGNVVINTNVTTSADKGNIFLLADQSVGYEIEETELWVYPLDVVRIGPNP